MRSIEIKDSSIHQASVFARSKFGLDRADGS